MSAGAPTKPAGPAPGAAGSPTAKAAGRRSFWHIARLLLLFFALVAAILVVIALALPQLAIAAAPGVMVGAVTVLLRGRLRDGLLAAVAQAVLSGAAFLVTHSPWESGVLMAFVGVAMALGGRVGWRTVLMAMAVFTAGAFFPTHVPGDAPPGSLQGAVGIALAVLLGGVLGAVVLRVVLRHHHAPHSSPPVAWPDVLVNAVALGATLLLGTAAVLAWDRGPVASWLMITIVVLAQPTDERTMRRSAQRLFGSLAGSLIAAGFALVLATTWQSAIVAFAFFIVAWSYRLSHPAVETGHGYWIYTVITTPAMILLAVPYGGDRTLEAAGQRAGLTIIGVIAVVLVTQVVRWVVVRATEDRELIPPATR